MSHEGPSSSVNAGEQVGNVQTRARIVFEGGMDLSDLESKLPALAVERDGANRFYYAREFNNAIVGALSGADPSAMSLEDLLKVRDIFITAQMLSQMGGRSIKGIAYPEGFEEQHKRYEDELAKRVDILATEGKAEEVPEDWMAEAERKGVEANEYQRTFIEGTNGKTYSIKPDSEEGKIFFDRQKKFNSLWQKREAA
jgi:hypothetical protein